MNKKPNNNSLKRSNSIIKENLSKSTRLTSNINVYEYFSQQRPFTNLKIIFNNQIIYCDKSSLSSASPILCEELLKPINNESLIFNDIKLNDFLSMLEFIYPIFNPEINEENISSLIELSYRFQFDMLKHACQIYVLKYLNTIQRVFHNHYSKIEKDYFLNKTSQNLIQFHNQICIDAYDIIINFCRWLKIYYKHNNLLVIQAIISVLQQISVDYLEQSMMIIDMNDEIKAYIYKHRAFYLEQIKHMT